MNESKNTERQDTWLAWTFVHIGPPAAARIANGRSHTGTRHGGNQPRGWRLFAVADTRYYPISKYQSFDPPIHRPLRYRPTCLQVPVGDPAPNRNAVERQVKPVNTIE